MPSGLSTAGTGGGGGKRDFRADRDRDDDEMSVVSRATTTVTAGGARGHPSLSARDGRSQYNAPIGHTATDKSRVSTMSSATKTGKDGTGSQSQHER